MAVSSTLLRPLEFRDCVVDGPRFRIALLEHEKQLRVSSKRMKDVYVAAERLFKAMDQVHVAFEDFSESLLAYSLAHQHSSSNGNSAGDRSSQISETDDEVTIRCALDDFAHLLQHVEEARSTMLAPMKSTVLSEIDEMRTVWLTGTKTDPKAFLKDTNSFCQRLEKYVSLKPKEQTAELDDQMVQERHRFILRAFEHVTNIHEAEELSTSKFVQTISLLMQVIGNFYHQAFDLFDTSHSKLFSIHVAAQRSAQNFRQISDETEELKMKLLRSSWEQIQPTDSSWIREGYLFSPVKKALSTQWVKHFCVYNREQSQLTMTPFTQTRVADVFVSETFGVRSCTRRLTDNVDRRFCFEVETDRSTVLTLQAQSQSDLQQWLRIMDGKDVDSTIPTTPANSTNQTFTLNDQTFCLLCDLIDLIELNGLQVQGVYRISGQKSKVDPVVQQALSPSGITHTQLSQFDTHTLASVLRQFLRQLDEPLLTYALHDQFLASVKCNPVDRLTMLSHVLGQLPPLQMKFLKMLIRHLARVADESRHNNMTASNLAIVFAPTLLRSREETVAAIMNTKFTSLAIELMIENHTFLFGDLRNLRKTTVGNTGILPRRPRSAVTDTTADSGMHSPHLIVDARVRSTLFQRPSLVQHMSLDDSTLPIHSSPHPTEHSKANITQYDVKLRPAAATSRRRPVVLHRQSQSSAKPPYTDTNANQSISTAFQSNFDTSPLAKLSQSNPPVPNHKQS